MARNLEELLGLMKDLPDYADQFLNMTCKVLQEYRETCHTCYRSEYTQGDVPHVLQKCVCVFVCEGSVLLTLDSQTAVGLGDFAGLQTYEVSCVCSARHVHINTTQQLLPFAKAVSMAP